MDDLTDLTGALRARHGTGQGIAPEQALVRIQKIEIFALTMPGAPPKRCLKIPFCSKHTDWKSQANRNYSLSAHTCRCCLCESKKKRAETTGFEPAVGLLPQPFSRRLRSASPARLHLLLYHYRCLFAKIHLKSRPMFTTGLDRDKTLNRLTGC